MKIIDLDRKTRRLVLCFAVTLLMMQRCPASAPVDHRPRVLVIYADWCPLCQRLKPTLALINEKYHGQIRFIRFDVTSEATVTESKIEARKLGLEDFFKANLDQTSLVVIQDANGHQVFHAVHDYDVEHYEAVLDQELHRERK